MGLFSLTNLVPWARRAGGDDWRREREELVADGGTRAFLSNGTTAQVLAIEIDGVPLPSGQYTVDDNMLVFSVAPTEGAELFVTYDYARYTDEAMTHFLSDAARVVESDLGIRWSVFESVGIIQDSTDLIIDADGEWVDSDGRPDSTIEKLIVYRTAMSIFEEKSAQAADDAITVRDGSTMIDTSKASNSTGKMLERINKQYLENLTRARLQRFGGASIAFDKGWK